MTRSKARQLALQISFAASSSEQDPSVLCDEMLTREYLDQLLEEDDLYKEDPTKQSGYIKTLVCEVAAHKDELDAVIEEYASGWKLNRISAITKEILRCAIAEILFIEDVPTKVAINEAVDLAKKYDDPEAANFINGILGNYVRNNTELLNTDE